MTQDEIIEMARDAGLRIDVRGRYFFVSFCELSDLLDAATAKEREALAQEQEPVAYLCEPDEDGLFDLPTPDKGCKDCFAVYRHPKRTEQEPMIAFNAEVIGYVAPQRTWVGLTVEEIAACCMESTTTQLSFYNAIEAKLKEKNT